MPNINVTVATDTATKVVLKIRISDKEPKMWVRFDTTKFVNMLQANCKDRDFYLQDIELTYEQLLTMVITGVPFTRWQVTRLIDVFGRKAVKNCLMWGGVEWER